jgi:heat shock protein HslJ
VIFTLRPSKNRIERKNEMKAKTYLVILVLVTILSACGGSSSSDAVSIEGTKWELIYYRKSTVAEGIVITAAFEDGQITGSAGCNSYFGSYEIDGNKISIDQLANTEMFCMDPEGVMDFETMYLDWLRDAQTISISDGQVMIFRSDGEALTFIPQE